MRLSQNLHSDWKFLEPTSNKFLPAQVPGCIHTDLRRHELIPDPFWGANEVALQWIEERNWTYRCEFAADAALFKHDSIDLVADGLDTVATIRLNGRKIARTENMFTAHRFAISEILRPGKNQIEIEFESPMKTIRARMLPDHYKEWCDPVGGSSVLRKQQCSFGWDWGPRFATCGIYKSIRLEAWSQSRFESVRITQTHTKSGVDLNIQPRLSGNACGEVRGSICFDGNTIAPIENLHATIAQPRLWWPNGHGAQPLYTVKLELVRAGLVLDTWAERIGLRTIELDRHPDEFGESFQFVVNGISIFTKGSNWIPAHSFVTAVSRDTYDDLLTSAVDAHMDMIRVWGGGIYEMEDFYDLCDEKGLLVWQDFMFACALYPGDHEFIQSVKTEAAHQVKRLANRASLALWCGNNELEQMPAEILRTKKRKKAYEDIFYRVLPAAVAEWDGITPYWPSSPHNPEGYEKGFNNERAGDCHFWDVWHARKPVKCYEEKGFRFCSEFGMQSYSSPEIAATFCPPEEFNVFGTAMENHQKNPAGNLIILDYVSRLYRLPKDYPSLAYLSQLNQAYCMKVGIEHFRRSMPRTMGALYWQLNDCWPVFSWSSLEFGGKWKALHFAAKRFFAPVIVSAHVPGDETQGIGNRVRSTIQKVHLHTVNDRAWNVSGLISWALFHLDGRILESGEKRVRLKPREAIRQKSLNFGTAMKTHGARNIYLRIRLTTNEGDTSEDTVFLTAPRFLELPREVIQTKVKAISPKELKLTFRSKSFQHRVQFELPGIDHRSDDNFFELYPGEARTVRIRTVNPVLASDVEKRLEIRTLANSY